MTQPPLSELTARFPASGIRRAFEASRGVADLIQLTIGEPDLPTPDWIVAEATQALARGETKYSDNAGILPLREAVARRTARRYGRDIDPSEVMIGFGAMEGLFLALTATVGAGDEVILADPGYPNYLGQLAVLGATAVTVPVDRPSLRLDPERLIEAISPRTRAILLNSPSNPLGTVHDRAAVDRIVTEAAARGIWVISDEVYDTIVFGDEPFPSAHTAPVLDNVIVVNSLSKAYAMTGWRVGYAIGPRRLIATLPQLQESVASSLPPFIQSAAVAALDRGDADAERMRQVYASRRALVLDAVDRLPGLALEPVAGAFYAFIGVEQTGRDDERFCAELLQHHAVALVPGSAFGPSGRDWVRLSFAQSETGLRAGLARIGDYLAGLA